VPEERGKMIPSFQKPTINFTLTSADMFQEHGQDNGFEKGNLFGGEVMVVKSGQL